MYYNYLETYSSHVCTKLTIHSFPSTRFPKDADRYPVWIRGTAYFSIWIFRMDWGQEPHFFVTVGDGEPGALRHASADCCGPVRYLDVELVAASGLLTQLVPCARKHLVTSVRPIRYYKYLYRKLSCWKVVLHHDHHDDVVHSFFVTLKSHCDSRVVGT